MRRVLIVLAMIAMSAPALAQGITPSIPLADERISDEEKARAAAREEAARAASARIPAQQKLSNDPWSGARDVTPPANPNPMMVAPAPKQKKK